MAVGVVADSGDFKAAAVGAIVGGAICAISDTDADGVKNYKDDCRGTAEGGIVDARCCEIDSDGDGVVDRLDECPETPRGVVVNERGCEIDSDSDGVVNSMDKCPNTTKGTPVDNNGCKLAPVFKLEGVNFEFDSAKLTAVSTATLDAAIKIMTRHPDVKVEIAGHTDSHGDAGCNLKLSERRAKAVEDYLIAHGANDANVTIKGYGESQPVADNDTEAGRAANRRVELRH